MATESISKPVNGAGGVHQHYGLPEQSSQVSGSNSGSLATGGIGEESVGVSGSGEPSSTGTGEGGNASVPKDEVGWYFVEQYYTTLSKTPEKLHLFYSKRSQFVSGVEAEKVTVSVGQRAINERIKELDIQDCKVRVSNVDSQESFKNIVVQVIGEMSNKAAPHRKFVQTFVLAEQPNGYFVLNDIFRYINEEEEEEEEPLIEEAAGNPVAVAEPRVETAALTPPADDVEPEHDDEANIEKLEEQPQNDKADVDEKEPEQVSPESTVADEATEEVRAEDASDVATTTPDKEDEASPETPEQVGIAEALEPESPQEPEPTPIASPPSPKATPTHTSPPVPPSKPAAPKTWANLVASNRVASPAVPNQTPSSAINPVPAQPKLVPASAARSITPPNLSGDDTQNRNPPNGNAGWQMAGHENGKRQGRQQSLSGHPEKDTVLGYIKNVTERVDASLLKSTLLEYGNLVYFDVSRQKNCAFVEFADATGYNNAVSANPHSIGGELIYVEERRPRPNAYGGGFGGRGGMRGGRPGNDGRPGGQGRGNYPKDGGRGGFTPRGRGSMTPRGRGQPQAA